MDDHTDPSGAPPAWINTLLTSNAQIERGGIVPMEPVLGRMRAAIARIEARQAAGHDHKA